MKECFKKGELVAVTLPVCFCRCIPSTSLPVTQQMTEMSISREGKVLSPKAEAAGPGN